MSTQSRRRCIYGERGPVPAKPVAGSQGVALRACVSAKHISWVRLGCLVTGATGSMSSALENELIMAPWKKVRKKCSLLDNPRTFFPGSDQLRERGWNKGVNELPFVRISLFFSHSRHNFSFIRGLHIVVRVTHYAFYGNIVSLLLHFHKS